MVDDKSKRMLSDDDDEIEDIARRSDVTAGTGSRANQGYRKRPRSFAVGCKAVTGAVEWGAAYQEIGRLFPSFAANRRGSAQSTEPSKENNMHFVETLVAAITIGLSSFAWLRPQRSPRRNVSRLPRVQSSSRSARIARPSVRPSHYNMIPGASILSHSTC